LLTLVSDKVRAFRFGQTVPCMKAGGEITKPMAKVVLSMLMETSMTATGKTIKLMGSVSILT
jgi:hypothetical protein